ncbi:MAG: prepilin-type N-terminal cleavage/methylation domain-containing protein [Planctomycetes bacterium]|nr:prepilin-type N-terminal cleavage/methylation domain-containing protein [Planctomycetota bacterium]
MRRAFTLIELLVVVSIIALLIAILLPSLKRARDAAKTVTCAANIRQLSTVSIAYSVEWRGQYPDWHNDSGRWGTNWMFPSEPNLHTFDRDARDYMLKTYGLVRDMFYCPSNHDDWWNRDDFWNFGSLESVFGYIYTAAAPKGFGMWNYLAGTRDAFADRVTDKPMYQTLWADLNRQIGGVGWYRFDKARGSNHFDDVVDGPTGTNVGYLDGHVEWKNFGDMAPEATRGGWQFWW